MGVFLFLIISLLCSCSLEEQPGGKAYVVTVGIDYSNTYFTTLNGTVRDSVEVGQCLAESYEYAGIDYEITTMNSSGPSADETSPLYPTSSNIVRKLDEIDASEDDLIVFYFSGHGLSRAGDSFIACAKEGKNAYTELWMEDLFELLSDKECSCVVIVDSCFSGYLALNGDTDTDLLQAFEKMFSEKSFSNVSVICSCGTDEKSSEASFITSDGSIEIHGAFTLKLLDSLGWEHTCTGGYVANPQRLLSVQKLYRKIIGSWFSGNQFPVTNKNVVGVNIIP